MYHQPLQLFATKYMYTYQVYIYLYILIVVQLNLIIQKQTSQMQLSNNNDLTPREQKKLKRMIQRQSQQEKQKAIKQSKLNKRKIINKNFKGKIISEVKLSGEQKQSGSKQSDYKHNKGEQKEEREQIYQIAQLIEYNQYGSKQPERKQQNLEQMEQKQIEIKVDDKQEIIKQIPPQNINAIQEIKNNNQLTVNISHNIATNISANNILSIGMTCPPRTKKINKSKKHKNKHTKPKQTKQPSKPLNQLNHIKQTQFFEYIMTYSYQQKQKMYENLNNNFYAQEQFYIQNKLQGISLQNKCDNHINQIYENINKKFKKQQFDTNNLQEKRYLNFIQKQIKEIYSNM